MHGKDIDEKITITINVNGENMKPITMGKFAPTSLVEDDMQSYRQERVVNADGKPTGYYYMVRISRRKTHEEEVGYNANP